MTKRQRKVKLNNVAGVVLGFADLVDAAFERLTGEPIASWFKQLGQQPRELPGGEPAAPQQDPDMLLADAYAVLGLPQTASFEEVKRNYRRLAVIFHPDRGGYEDAMKLLNNAKDVIEAAM